MPDLTTEEQLAAAQSEVARLTTDNDRLQEDIQRIQAKFNDQEDRIFRKKFNEKWAAFLKDEAGQHVLSHRLFLWYSLEGTFLMASTDTHFVRIQITDQGLIDKLKAITTDPDGVPGETTRIFSIWPED